MTISRISKHLKLLADYFGNFLTFLGYQYLRPQHAVPVQEVEAGVPTPLHHLAGDGGHDGDGRDDDDDNHPTPLHHQSCDRALNDGKENKTMKNEPGV